MYAKTLAFLVGVTNMYGGILYQIYHLPLITIPFFNLLTCNSSGVIVGFWITSKYLSGYAKLYCDCLNEYLLEQTELQSSYQ